MRVHEGRIIVCVRKYKQTLLTKKEKENTSKHIILILSCEFSTLQDYFVQKTNTNTLLQRINLWKPGSLLRPCQVRKLH